MTKPTIYMTKYINSIKGTSSRILFEEFPEIKMKLCIEQLKLSNDIYGQHHTVY